MLLLHGFTDTWRAWTPLLAALEARHAVFAPTLPGHHGGTPFEEGVPITIPASIDVLERQLDKEGIERAHVVGNSFGGWAALELAVRGRALSVVALCPGGGWEPAAASRRDRPLLRPDQPHAASGTPDDPRDRPAAAPAAARASRAGRSPRACERLGGVRDVRGRRRVRDRRGRPCLEQGGEDVQRPGRDRLPRADRLRHSRPADSLAGLLHAHERLLPDAEYVPLGAAATFRCGTTPCRSRGPSSR